jgi:tetratricopeptide (TPR) repeat protein
MCLLLVATVLVSYQPVTRNSFLNYDDDRYITNNPHVRAGLTGATVEWAFSTYEEANWHPLTWLSHALDIELFGLNPAGHHYENVLLHAANAVLLFLLLQSATGFCWRSLMVAALLALHPINVETVAWAAERKNVLSMLFFLLALHAYVWYARRPALRRYAMVALLFALGLLSKPQVITFPLLLGLWDYWPLRRISEAPALDGEARDAGAPGLMPRFGMGWLVAEKLPLLLLSAASALVTMNAQKAGGAIKGLSLYTPALRIETAAMSYVTYLGKAVWPSKLVALYPHPTALYPAGQVFTGLLLLALITAFVLRAGEQRYLVVGWLWFLGSLVPMIGLVQVGAQGMADRYAYVSFIGLFLMLVWLASDWAKAHQLRVVWLAVPAIGWLLVLGVLTYRQIGYWHDIPSFWNRTLALTENNYVAHDMLGDYLAREGRDDEAAAHFRAALAIRPDDLPANLDLGAYEHGRGNLMSAIERYKVVAQHAGDVGLRASAYGNLGSAYRQMGDVTQAKQCFEMSLHLVPGQPMSLVGLGLIAEKNGDAEDAVREYSSAMAVQPTDVGYLLLAHALQQEGKLDEAKAVYDRVARLSPNLSAAQQMAESLRSGK